MTIFAEHQRRVDEIRARIRSWNDYYVLSADATSAQWELNLRDLDELVDRGLGAFAPLEAEARAEIDRLRPRIVDGLNHAREYEALQEAARKNLQEAARKNLQEAARKNLQ